MSDFRLSGSAEFPNDNPSLHDGAVWVCFATCGPLRPVVRPQRGRSTTIPASSRSEGPPFDGPAAIPEGSRAEPADDVSPLPPLELELTPAGVATPVEPGPLELELTPTQGAMVPTSGGPGAESGLTSDTSSVDATEAESTRTFANMIPPEPPRLEEDEDRSSAGCSLSADLAPVDAADMAPRVSEMRSRQETRDIPVANDPTTDGAARLEIEKPLSASDAAQAVEIAGVLRALVDVECAPPEREAPVSDVEQAAESERVTILPPPSDDGDTRTLTLATIHVRGKSVAPEPIVAQSAAVPVDGAVQTSGAASAAVDGDPFAAFIRALVEVALGAGATRAAALLPGFLEGASQDGSAFSDAVRASMVSSGIALEHDGALSPSVVFAATSTAWRRVLRNESNDFSACGTSTLDAWAADLLKAFGVGGDGRVDVRRELRRRGVAAFGMILAA